MEDFQAWNYFRKLSKYQDFGSVSVQIKGITLYFTTNIFTMYVPLFTYYNLGNTEWMCMKSDIWGLQ